MVKVGRIEFGPKVGFGYNGGGKSAPLAHDELGALADKLASAKEAMRFAMDALESEDPEKHKAAFYRLQEEFEE